MRTINNKFFETKNISRKSNIILDKTKTKFAKIKYIIKFCKMVSEHTSIPEKILFFTLRKKYFNSFNSQKTNSIKKYFYFQR